MEHDQREVVHFFFINRIDMICFNHNVCNFIDLTWETFGYINSNSRRALSIGER